MKSYLSILLVLALMSLGRLSSASDETSNESHSQRERTEESSHEDAHSNELHHENEGSRSKTIIGVEEEGKRFKLTKKAIETLKLKFSPCDILSGAELSVPASALVQFARKHGVFVHKADWFELLEVVIVSKKNQLARVKPTLNHLEPLACEVVISGVPLLRVAQLEASGEGGEGHAH